MRSCGLAQFNDVTIGGCMCPPLLSFLLRQQKAREDEREARRNTKGGRKKIISSGEGRMGFY